jgi:dephospho-CoA kinase
MARLVVAVTGGIASGKSLVDHAFAALGVPVLDADVIARELVTPGAPALSEIVESFGPAVLSSDGSLDRKLLRSLIFENPVLRKVLENILHPRIRTTLCSRAHSTDAAYVVVSIPLLTEAGGTRAYPWLDRILVVDSSVEQQMDRLVRRDNVTRDLANAMILSQASREDRLAIATDVIVNDASPESVIPAVEALHRRFSRATR